MPNPDLKPPLRIVEPGEELVDMAEDLGRAWLVLFVVVAAALGLLAAVIVWGAS